MASDKQIAGNQMAIAINPPEFVVQTPADWFVERIRGLRVDPNYDAWVRYHLHVKLCDRADHKINRAWSEAW